MLRLCFRHASIQRLKWCHQNLGSLQLSSLYPSRWLHSQVQLWQYGISAAPLLYFARINLIQKDVLSPSTPRKCLIVFFCPRSVHMSTPNKSCRPGKTPHPPDWGIHSTQNTWNKNRDRDSFLDKNNSCFRYHPCFKWNMSVITWLQKWTQDFKCAWTSI